MTHSEKGDLFLYAHDKCLTFQHEKKKEIANQLIYHMLTKPTLDLDFLIDNRFLNKPLRRLLCNAMIKPFLTRLVLHGTLIHKNICKKDS